MRTRLIRIRKDDLEWFDNKAFRFLYPFKIEKKKKWHRADIFKGLRDLLENSEFYFPDNLFTDKKKRYIAEYKKGRFKL